jgi:SAM-dependent methyltransferase
LRSIANIMANVTAYRLWQAPFAEKKFLPVVKYNDLRNVQRVLDVGCGPGTNTSHFKHCEYVGLDWNESYVEYARRRYQRDFFVADVCDYVPPQGQLYDFILVNSFFHHIDDENTHKILKVMKTLLAPGGHVHILDLVMPDRPSIARLLAQWDRGDFARSLDHWREIFSGTFSPVMFEPYPLTGFGVTLWSMVYFKGRSR